MSPAAVYIQSCSVFFNTICKKFYNNGIRRLIYPMLHHRNRYLFGICIFYNIPGGCITCNLRGIIRKTIFLNGIFYLMTVIFRFFKQELICDREKEVRNFVSEEYWTINLKLRKKRSRLFEAELTAIDGEKPVLPDKATTQRVAVAVADRKSVV